MNKNKYYIYTNISFIIILFSSLISGMLLLAGFFILFLIIIIRKIFKSKNSHFSLKNNKKASFSNKNIILPINKKEKEGYRQLIDLLVREEKRAELYPLIEHLKNIDEKGRDTLHQFIHLSENNKHKIIRILDPEITSENLLNIIKTILIDNYNVQIELPFLDQNVENSFLKYDDLLRKSGYQLGFIQTNTSEYVLLLLETKQKFAVFYAVSFISHYFIETIE